MSNVTIPSSQNVLIQESESKANTEYRMTPGAEKDPLIMNNQVLTVVMDEEKEGQNPWSNQQIR